ncbi:zinc-binding protein A33-like [Leuresthes tenuis]|uniref:zinc-binding protein A33-like n=1 Tax=Leuresthes tenuis TaxID=355514 RepID=UPI003B50C928
MSLKSENDLSCTLCHEVFKEPVNLECNHSFCKDCLKEWWSEKQIRKCPLCKEISLFKDPTCNLELKTRCEAFLLERGQKASAGPEPLCSDHAEKIKLFCLNHQQPLCVVCRDSKAHIHHRFSPVNEAALDHRAKLLKSLNPLKEKQKLFKRVKEGFDQKAAYIELQTQHVSRKIGEEFNKFHQFLRDEEEARMSALKKEQNQKSYRMKDKSESLGKEIEALSETINAMETELRAGDVSFLQNYQAAVERIQRFPLIEDPQPVSEALIDEAKHLGNLNFHIWNKMKEMVSFSPLILDPNTAHPELILSEDLTSVMIGQRQKLPDNPERFDQHCYVLGSEGFDSGTHSWDVEVRNEQFWGVGVVKKSIERKGEIQTGYWEICLIDGKYKAVSPPLPDKVLLVKKLERVRVQLDWDRGRVIFIDLDTKKQIHIFKHTFTEELFPYIGIKNKLPLKITPMTISVAQEHAVPLSAGFWGF